jgi:hypothetical protein
MIRYNVQCDQDHDFDGWFKNSAGFEQQLEAGDIVCPVCGSLSVSKGLMTPNVANARKQQTAHVHDGKSPEILMEAMRQLCRHVEKTSDDVGDKFTEEARKIHYGEARERGIYGKADVKQIEELTKEGIETCPLPVLPEDHN